MSAGTSAPREPQPQENKTVLRIQQYLKDKNGPDSIPPAANLTPAPPTPSTLVDLNQNTIVRSADAGGGLDHVDTDILKRILDEKKALLLRQPDVIAALKAIADAHK